MSTCSFSLTCHCFSAPKPLKIGHQLNPSKHSNLRQGKTGTKCCNARRREGGEAPPKDYYQTLGVSVHATPREIKEAYRRLQKKHHPDVAGQRGHEYTMMLNEAYHALMRDDIRRVSGSGGRKRDESASNFSGSGYSSWKGPLRPQALFVDEYKCIGCRQCVHHATETFVMDEVLGCARVLVQFGDHEDKIEVAIDSCPVNCIHWVEREELPLLEFLVRPQPKEADGVFGGGWERPEDVFSAAKYFSKQLKQHGQRRQTNIEDETPAQAEARYQASLKLQSERFLSVWSWVREQLNKRN